MIAANVCAARFMTTECKQGLFITTGAFALNASKYRQNSGRKNQFPPRHHPFRRAIEFSGILL